VVLIPNIHMETPHYTITRLRHDELNLSGAAEPSYKMALVPEAESVYQTAQEAAPARQVAAVKSIAPPQPVPAARPVVPAEPQAKGGLLDRIVGWFKKRGEETSAVEAAPAAEPVPALARSERPSERRERKPSQRRGRGEGRGEARNGEARAQEPRQVEAREGREARGSEQPKQPRPPRQPKPRPEAEAAPRATEVAEAPREPGSEEKREPRSRRGRGNRRPREARPETAAGMAEAAPHAVIESAAAPVAAPSPARFHAIIEIAGAPKAAPAAVAPAQQSLQLETAPGASLQPAVTASPATILADLAASTANLQQVETQGAVISTTETREAGRPRRRRRPTAKPEAEPMSLMQVETTAPVTSIAETATTSAAPHPTRRRTRPQVSETQEPLVQVETQLK
jgi:ribonuclease E